MSYKVVPFTSSISNNGNANDVAQQVQSCIQREATSGWEYVSSANIDTTVEGSNGCFGFGAKPSYSKSTMVLVFKQ